MTSTFDFFILLSRTTDLTKFYGCLKDNEGVISVWPHIPVFFRARISVDQNWQTFDLVIQNKYLSYLNNQINKWLMATMHYWYLLTMWNHMNFKIVSVGHSSCFYNLRLQKFSCIRLVETWNIFFQETIIFYKQTIKQSTEFLSATLNNSLYYNCKNYIGKAAEPQKSGFPRNAP